jgi:hypothetical protein
MFTKQVGAVKNAGKRWQTPGEPEVVHVHDFAHPGEG